ncbi:MAG TPA: hypothetical protein VMM18_00675 [Gemmatimonadaceae bacterium]|nr:hypothetical protein [Gemmatimonadaceae bacterium]
MTDTALTGAAAASAEAGGDPADVSGLWLETFRAIADRAAHELRGALNGVALNVEVVRSRAARPAAGLDGIAPFAEAGAEQLGLVVERTEALLALARRPASPLDVRSALGHLVTLLAPGAVSAGGALSLADAGADDFTTSADPETARLVLASLVLAAASARRPVLCRITGGDAIIVRVEVAAGPLPIAEAHLRAAAGAGIGVENTTDATIVAFPANTR